MKKISLSMQIGLIFIIAFIATYTLLAINIVNQLDDIFEKNIFDRLESSAKELAALENVRQAEIDPMFAYISYSSQSNMYSASSYIGKYVSEEHAQLLINKATMQTNSISSHKNLIDEKQIYYVVLNYGHSFETQNNDIFIVLTDHKLKNNMVKKTSVQILIACLLAYMLGYLLIYLWVHKLTNSTKKIAKSLHDMGKNHYETTIASTRGDEIGDLAESIELMRRKIISNEKQKQEIIQGVSHDLKTPVAIIQSYAEALQDGIYSADEVSKITLKQCDRLNSKVSKLLTLTRIGYFGMNDINLGTANMQKLVQDTAKLYAGKSTLHFQFKTKPVVFTGDEESWQIVLDNLLDNAIRYAKSQIIISLSENQLSIYNDGVNIHEKRTETMFNAYEKGADGNHGLGLSIVKRTVDLFGYDVSVENMDDGVKFIISRK